MTIETIYRVRCNECKRWSGILHFRKRDVRPVAKDDGWLTKQRDGETVDICPRCQAGNPYKQYYGD